MLRHLGTQTIQTSRLILRKHEMADAEDMFRNWVTDPEVSRFWGWEPHKNIEETRAVLAGWIAEYKKPDTYHWIIVLKGIAQAIGYIYLTELSDADDSASIHFALSRKYWNQGLMSEACGRVLTFAFSQLHGKRIHSRHHVDNSASGRVMQKCGLRYVKTEHRQIPDCARISGDYCYCEITTEDWERAKKA